MTLFVNILISAWGVVQETIGWIASLFTGVKGLVMSLPQGRGAVAFVFVTGSCWGGVTLGRCIFLCKELAAGVETNMDGVITKPTTAMMHEYGHFMQSCVLGPLYLLLIGIPSIIHAAWWTQFGRSTNYYSFFTEAWADKNGGVKR